MIRSNGARAASSGESMPSATASSSSPAPWPSFTPLIAALSRATSIATGSMSVAMHFASRPQRQRREGEQAGAGADVGDIGERAPSRSSRSSAARQPAVVACWPVPKARLASISKLIAPGVGRDRSACGRRSGRRGSAAARPGSSSPNRPRRAARSRGAPLPSSASSASSSPRRLDARNKRGSASRRASPDPARRRPAPAGRRRPANRSSASAIASPCARVQGMVTRQLIWPRLPSPAARRAPASAAPHSPGRRCGSISGALPASRSSMSLRRRMRREQDVAASVARSWRCSRGRRRDRPDGRRSGSRRG